MRLKETKTLFSKGLVSLPFLGSKRGKGKGFLGYQTFSLGYNTPYSEKPFPRKDNPCTRKKLTPKRADPIKKREIFPLTPKKFSNLNVNPIKKRTNLFRPPFYTEIKGYEKSLSSHCKPASLISL